MPKLKNPTIAQLKRKLDEVFSLFIRAKDSVNGYNRCITCGVRKLIKELHCGHFISRTHLSLRWDERNCWPQCPACNLFHEGEKPTYALRLIEKYGHKAFKDLVKRGNEVKQWRVKELEAMIEEYKTKLKNL